MIDEREPAEFINHGDRDMVGGKLFPAFHQHIVYAVLSPDGTGPTSYGKVMVRWEVKPNYLKGRIVLLEENSYHFFDRHELGRIGAEEPPGYRAIWEDRAKLSVAKLGPRLMSSTNREDIPNLLLQQGSGRDDDDFVEVAIYADEGLDAQDVNKVTVQVPASTPDETRCYHRIKDLCREHNIEFHD